MLTVIGAPAWLRVLPLGQFVMLAVPFASCMPSPPQCYTDHHNNEPESPVQTPCSAAVKE